MPSRDHIAQYFLAVLYLGHTEKLSWMYLYEKHFQARPLASQPYICICMCMYTYIYKISKNKLGSYYYPHFSK